VAPPDVEKMLGVKLAAVPAVRFSLMRRTCTSDVVPVVSMASRVPAA
jgi:hypothetical protein